MAGIRMAPTAAASAAAEPDIPAKNIAETMVTAASPPGKPTHQSVCKIDDSATDAARFHDDPREHEQRDRHQVEGIHATEHFLYYHHQWGKVP